MKETKVVCLDSGCRMKNDAGIVVLLYEREVMALFTWS